MTEQTGAMVALVPTAVAAARLAVDGGVPPDELHLTLFYLGEAADYDEQARDAIVARLRSLVDELRPDYELPVTAGIYAVDVFNPGEAGSGVVLGVTGGELEAVWDLTADTLDELEAEPAGFTLPEQHAPWVPHITLAYTDDPAGVVADVLDRTGPVTFDRIRVAFAGDAIDIPLLPSTGAKRYDPHQFRLPAGPHAGEWAHHGGAAGPFGSLMPDLGEHDELPLDELPKVSSAVHRAFDSSHGGLTAAVSDEASKLYRDEHGRAVVRAEGVIRNRDGKIVGSFRRNLYPETGEVHNDTFALAATEQGAGFAQRFAERSEGILAEQGFTHATVSATGVGGYAWAKRYGWDPAKPTAAGDVPDRIRSVANTYPLTPGDARTVQRWLRAFQQPDQSKWPTPSQVANFGKGTYFSLSGDRLVWPGKEIMIGSAWSGVRNLRPPSKGAGVIRTAAAGAVPAKRFDRDQLRDPHTGEWIDATPGSGAADALGLAGRIDLDPGERLVSSSRFKDPGGSVDMLFAVVHGDHGSDVRIGLIPLHDSDRWKAANKGGTATLEPDELRQFRADLDAATKRGAALAREADRHWNTGSAPTDPVLLGTEPVATGRVETIYADLDWDVYITDGDGVTPSWNLTVRPVSHEGDEQDGIQLDPKPAQKLLAHLADIQSQLDSTAKERGAGMSRKALTGLQIKSADAGEISAVFCTFGVVDHDNDVVLKGAIPQGKEVVISAYNHASWGPGAIPVGKGVIRIAGNEAVLDGQLFLDTQAGRDTFNALKQLGDLAEYSWGYDVLDGTPNQHGGRNLKSVDVHEVSPVLKGASIGTRTLALKERRVPSTLRGRRGIGVHETKTVSRPWDSAATEKALDTDRPSDLRTVYAWVDSDGDPELKSSYRFPHHHGVQGPANLRACLSGIAVLNGARGGADVPDADRKAVYEHLASHLRDADREPPEFRVSGAPTKFNDELLETLAGVSGLLDSAQRVVALRASKGKSLSKVNAELLDWIGDDLRRLDALLKSAPTDDADDGPSEDELASLFAASIARIHGI